MQKPWSVTTTVRNPDRLRGFLIALRELDGEEWNYENQKRYQIILIRNRLYGYGSAQFHNDLSNEQNSLLNDLSKSIPYEIAEDIFDRKRYKDPSMRGRQSINPLKKYGFVTTREGRVSITTLGRHFMEEENDLGEIFFRSFLKWQIPNPDSRNYSAVGNYDIRPFVGTLHLINSVNQKWMERGYSAKGLSKEEFSIFAPTLVNYVNIDRQANRIIDLRERMEGKTRQDKEIVFDDYTESFAAEFLGSNEYSEVNKLLKNLRDYGDNAIRYFRLTRYFYIRGGGYYIDIEPRRSVEIESLLDSDNAKSIDFQSREEYLEYLSDITLPRLPWETKEKHVQMVEKLLDEIAEYNPSAGIEPKQIVDQHADYKMVSDETLKRYIENLRVIRKELQDERNQQQSQTPASIEEYIASLENIFEKDNRAILLEKFASLGLIALNDAIKIKPNYPVGDDNEPTFTAPGGVSDIECYYERFNAICEVTMLKSRAQWYNEGQPVMRHLRDFEKSNAEKDSYCVFIAPSLHRDTMNTFWTSIKYEYEGSPQKIIPLSIWNFVKILKVLLRIRKRDQFLNHSDLLQLYDNILSDTSNHEAADSWIKNISNIIDSWELSNVA